MNACWFPFRRAGHEAVRRAGAASGQVLAIKVQLDRADIDRGIADVQRVLGGHGEVDIILDPHGDLSAVGDHRFGVDVLLGEDPSRAAIKGVSRNRERARRIGVALASETQPTEPSGQ